MGKKALGSSALRRGISIRVQLNRFLNSFCYLEVGAQGVEWQDAVNQRMVQLTIPEHVLRRFPTEIAGSEDIKVVKDKSLELWREADPTTTQIEEAKAVLSREGFRGLRAEYPLLAKALYASIRGSFKAWQKRVEYLAWLRDNLCAAWEDRTRTLAIPDQSTHVARTSCAVLYVALIEAYQDLGLPGGLRSEVNKQDPHLILVGTVQREDLGALLGSVESRIRESLQAQLGP